MADKDERLEKNKDQKSTLAPDPKTLNTPDPEKNMEGPVSSSTHKTGKIFDTNESREEADRRREEHYWFDTGGKLWVEGFTKVKVIK